jgi:2-polyprenyl-3-methyl-5-hydroxy-6-metoxy-1,4-benzoquinol methylase
VNKISRTILDLCGFSEHSVTDYSKKAIILRDGREAFIWIHKNTGHGILDPVFWENEDFYKEQYRNEFTSVLGNKVVNDKNLKISSRLNKTQFNDIKVFLNKNTKYLEIGCSFGGVFNQIVDYGVAEAIAIEPSFEDSQFVQMNNPKQKVINSLFENIELKENYFDVIVSIEVLEHTNNPAKFLEKCNKILNKNGVLYLEVPNHNDVLYSTYNDIIGYKNFYYHKAHIHYFSRLSLESLCEKYGFKGTVSSFLMYPFFNHVYWSQNCKPQGSAEKALYTPQPADENIEAGKIINNFYQKVEKEYEKMVNELMLGDCLTYKGFKT